MRQYQTVKLVETKQRPPERSCATHTLNFSLMPFDELSARRVTPKVHPRFNTDFTGLPAATGNATLYAGIE